ncbi:unnamed protein product [Discosporangium mesarthrocarpum]
MPTVIFLAVLPRKRPISICPVGELLVNIRRRRSLNIFLSRTTVVWLGPSMLRFPFVEHVSCKRPHLRLGLGTTQCLHGESPGQHHCNCLSISPLVVAFVFRPLWTGPQHPFKAHEADRGQSPIGGEGC